MKFGQTSIIFFISKVFSSIIGFFSMIYFARVLGAEILGIYAIVIAILSWLKLGGSMGFGTAIKKRISEGEEQGAYFTAGLLSAGVFTVILIIGILIFKSYIESYVTEFSEFAPISIVWFLIVLLFVSLLYELIVFTLKGQHSVHIAGILSPLKTGSQRTIQIGLIFAGYSLVGMLVGYGVGIILVVFVGFFYISVPLQIPKLRHFRSLYDYAKYSWLSGLKSRSFHDVDILILGIFVPSSLVGVYSVAWSIATFLKVFSKAVSETLFPEISRRTAEEGSEAAAELVESSLMYGGLIAIPGLVGSILIGERLLKIYGPEFTQGTTVLVLLIISTTCYSYQKQFLNAINAVNRPDIAFRINLVFILLNLFLNITFVWKFGWVGAAIATSVSIGVGLILSYIGLKQIVQFKTPVIELSRQAFAAVVMGGVVWFLIHINEATIILQNNIAISIVSITAGAGIYFLTLLTISYHFRSTVIRNVPHIHNWK